MNHQRSHCHYCGHEIYRNLAANASVKAWVHRQTGGKYCALGEPTVATPVSEGNTQ